MSKKRITMTPDMTKLVNKRAVLEYLTRHSPTSRAEIARRLELSKPTVSMIVSELIQDGFAREVGTRKFGQGRPSVEVEVNRGARCAIGIELDVSSATLIITDLLGCPLVDAPSRLEREIDTTTPQEAANGIAAMIKDAVAGLKRRPGSGGLLTERDHPRLIGIGIGVPAVVNSQTMQIISSNPLNWSGPAPFGSIIQQQTRAPILVTQRVMAAAWAEYKLGRAQGVNSMAYVRLGSGVASGIILNGQLYTGANYFAGNIADMCFLPHRSPVDLVQPVSLQSLVTRDAITARARQLLLEGDFTSSTALDAAGGDAHAITLEMLCAGAVQHDRLSRRVITEAGRLIGVALANLISILNPELIVLGGPLTLAGSALIDSAQEQVRKCCNAYELAPTRIVISELGDKASSLGAADLAIMQFLNASPLPAMRTPPLNLPDYPDWDADQR